MPGAGDREPDRAVGRRAGYSGGGGDGDRRVGEHAAGFGFTAGTGEGEEDPVGVAGGGGQLGVAVELAGEAIEAFGAVVVLDEEREAGAVVGPDAVAVGADDLAPLASAAPLGPPLLEGAAGPGASGAEQGGEEAVEADQVGESLAGGEVVGEAAPPGQVGQVGAVLGGDDSGAERPEDPVVWRRLAPGLGSEAVERRRGRTARRGASGPGVRR